MNFMSGWMKKIVRLGVPACVCACGIALRADVVITRVVVDGKDVSSSALTATSGHGGVPLRLRDSVRSIEFAFSERPFVARPSARLRYRLEGVDMAWKDLPQKIRVLLIFRNGDQQVVAQREFSLSGETPNWTGSVETSEYVNRREDLVVPESARSVRIAFLTHGGDVGVGVIGIDGVALTVRGESSGEVRRYDFSLPKETDVIGYKQNVASWWREGSALDIARLGLRSTPSPHPILVLVDDDALNYGNWSLSVPASVPVLPGDRLTVEWQNAYSVGASVSGTAYYEWLKPGTYTFRVAAFHVNGDPTGLECALPVTIFPPFYSRNEFWLVLAALAAAVAALIARVVEVGRVRRRVEVMEQEQALDHERARIARDLHDEMGAGLSSIAMQCDWIRRECADTVPLTTCQRIDSVCGSAVELVRTVDEIVWAVNPSNDTIERVVNYLTQYTEQYLDAAGLRFRFDISREVPSGLLTGSVRHLLFLAVKEALHNVVKHAECELLWLKVKIRDGWLVVTVEDNGKGFDMNMQMPDGLCDGLFNMRRRMQEASGRVEITSQPGGGTRVTFAVPWTEVGG